MKKLDMKTTEVTEENIEKLAALFPHCITEVKESDGTITRGVDFNLLKQEFSDKVVDGPRESYSINWPGKKEALISANTPINKTLRPCREESVDFDTTENLYIEGDNLEALKLLQESYLGKVKMIYIDPPYNTGKDFVYKDNYTRSREEELEESGQIDENGGRLVANPETNGRFHSDWLSMIYPRLKLARNLLKDDGVVVIHIDEAEYDNLYRICKEIFGEENDLGTIIWDKGNPKGDSKTVAVQNEFIITFAKNVEIFTSNNELQRAKKNAQKMLNKAKQLYRKIGKRLLPDDIKNCIKAYELELLESDFKLEYTLDNVNFEFQKWLVKQDFSNGEKAYKFIDKNGKVYQSVSMAWPNKKKAPADYMIPLVHPKTGDICPIPEKGWRNPSKTMAQLASEDLILFGKDDTTQPRRKYFLEENMNENIPSVISFGGSDDAFFKSINLSFDNPKPYKFSQELISYFLKNDELILDFFSGSATTAHSIMNENIQDSGHRNYILVQLPEAIKDTDEASKNGKYKTIADIARKRIEEAGKLIKQENIEEDFVNSLDVGFRALKIDSSNMKDVYYTPDAMSQSLLDTQEQNIKEDRNAEDLLFQVLLDWGVDLTLQIQKETISGKEVYFVDDDTLAACFDDDLNEEFVRELASKKVMRVVFKESGFASDEMKINIEQIFTQLSPDTEVRGI